jgi:hypothetical protein
MLWELIKGCIFEYRNKLKQYYESTSENQPS